MIIAMDTEFTGLHQKTSLVSISLVTRDGREFYAEFTDYERSQVTPWLEKNVINNLTMAHEHSIYTDIPYGWYSETHVNGRLAVCGSKSAVTERLRRWLAQFDNVEMWSDCLAYDWVLFCELFGGAMSIPGNIYYIPFDLCTAFKLKDIDPDVDRREFASMVGAPHNASFDAHVIMACLKKLGVA